MAVSYLTTTKRGIRYAAPGAAIPDFETYQASLAQDAESKNAPAHNIREIASGTVNAVDGDVIFAASGVTVQMPSPVSGAVVDVWATSTATGAAPAILSTTTNGGVMYAVGRLGVTAVNLGVPGEGCRLYSNGVNWVVLGVTDTGWVPLTLAAHVTAESGAAPPSACRNGANVELAGAIHGIVSSIAAFSTLASIPAGVPFPPTTKRWPAFDLINGMVFLTLDTSGNLTSSSTFNTTSLIYIDGLRYSASI